MSKLRINLDDSDTLALYDNLVAPAKVGTGTELIIRGPGPKFTTLGIIGNAQGVQIMEELHGDGAGSFRVPYAQVALQPNLFNYQNIVQVRIDGVIRHAWVIRNKSRVLVTSGEEGGRYYEVSGPGLKDWFNAAIVYPENPSSIPLSKLKSHSRYFNFGSSITGPWYNAKNWKTPGWTKLQSNLDPWHPGDSGGNPWKFAPIAMPDYDTARWMWPSDPTPQAPKGTCFFRKTFTTDKVGTYQLFATGDNTISAYIDGVPMVIQHNGPSTVTTDSTGTKVDSDTWRHLWSGTIDLNPGNHVVALKVENYDSTSPAAALAMLYRVGDGKKDIPAQKVLASGDSGWLSLAYPDDDEFPGWSPGEVLYTLMGEAQRRGVHTLVGLGKTFTKTHDSNGDPWQYSHVDYSFDIGTNYHDVISTLEELTCDISIDPVTFKLNAYNRQGVDRTEQRPATTQYPQGQQPVIFARAMNVTDSQENSTNDIINSFLVGYGEEKLMEIVDPFATISKYGRREVFNAVDSNLSDRVAKAIIQKQAEANHLPTDSVTLEIGEFEANRPWADFKIGDWVLAPHTGGGYRSRRVISIAAAMDDATGRAQYSLELDTKTQDRQDAIARFMQRHVGIALLGEEKQASSYSGGGAVGGSGTTSANTTSSSDGSTVGDLVQAPGGGGTQVFVQPDPPTTVAVGTLWFDTSLDGMQ
jgi:hypothetical protein